jgi:hypothetical protein
MRRFYEVLVGYAKGMNTQPQINGHPVVDTRMATIGRVTDVLYDDADTGPRWAVVKVGLLGSEHYMPLTEALLDQEGRVVVPFDKSSIKRAPRAGGRHVLTPKDERALRDYYGVAV